jgi:hypothetical protein
VIDVKRMQEVALAMRQDRAHRDTMWTEAEAHMAKATEYRLRREADAQSAQAKGPRDGFWLDAETRARMEGLAPHWLSLELTHLRIAVAYAAAAGVDVSEFIVPEVGQ